MNHHAWSPYIHTAMYSVLPPSRRIQERILFDYELIYIQKGTLCVTLEDTPILCREGSILLLRPGQRHILDVHGTDPLSQPHIHFDLIYDELSPRIPVSFRNRDAMNEQELSMIRPDLLPPGPLILSLSDLPRIHAHFLSVIDLYISEGNSLACKAAFLLLLSTLFTAVSQEPKTIANRINPRIASIREYIDHNYQQPLTLHQLEQIFHYNGSYITQAFHKIYHIPVIRYYNQRKGQAALKLLTEGHSVSGVSEMLGFSSVYAFSRFFRTMYQESPSAYRNRKNNPNIPTSEGKENGSHDKHTDSTL